ncbi:hypothetical protein [Algibacter sp. L4_22]|uniref:hypothetical protein n=1 Tax=Algibacter sp. L4_22 TaxID=2942477 RepID=UPI00201B9817|nr:hypothetical protein [Algibacter sp. L4_22]MCL5130302.1 hypothetical protein [Algibacter sp. L4_22]
MKNTFLIISFLLTATISKAQSDYQIIEKSLPYNKLATSFTTNIIGVGESLSIYNWQKFIEKHSGTTYVTSYGEGDIDLESKHVKFPLLKNQLVTIYSRFAPNNSETGVLLTIWIQKEDGTYYSSKTNPDSGKNIKQWLLLFHNELMDLNRTH